MLKLNQGNKETRNVMQKLACVIVILFLTIRSGFVIAFPKKEVILTTHNLCPYGCYKKHNKSHPSPDNFTGIAVDTVRCAFDKMEQPLKIVVVPWARAQYMVKNNQADGFFAASKNTSRDQFATLSATIADQKRQWYSLKENPLSPENTNFKHKATVAGFIGANMLKWMEKEKYHIMARTQNTTSLLKILLKGRVDAILANNYVMAELLKKHHATDRVKVFLNKEKPLGVYFSNTFLADKPLFLKDFNSYLSSCKAQ